jgi:predicted nucleic acid-binding protein
VLQRLRRGEWTAVLSNHLVHEYEEALKRHAAALSLSLPDVDQLLNAICARGDEWQLTDERKPILRDPDDEPLAQLARESRTPVIVTHNTRHLRPAEALGIRVLKPKDFLAILRQLE